jgi:hypothetical protein
MNKKIAIFVILMISLTALVYAYEYVSQQYFSSGWNLVYNFIKPSQLDETYLTQNHIKAVYAFNQETQEYVRMYPNSEEATKISDAVDDELIQNAFWVYSDTSVQTMKYRPAESDVIPFNERQIYIGWNFVAITPEMVGKTIFDIKGNCDIQKAYLWQASLQEWGFNLMEDTSAPDQLSEGDLYSGLVIKVSANCKLGDSNSGINPPVLP